MAVNTRNCGGDPVIATGITGVADGSAAAIPSSPRAAPARPHRARGPAAYRRVLTPDGVGVLGVGDGCLVNRPGDPAVGLAHPSWAATPGACRSARRSSWQPRSPQFHRWSAATSVDDAVLEQMTADVAELARWELTDPPVTVFSRLLGPRDDVFTLIASPNAGLPTTRGFGL